MMSSWLLMAGTDPRSTVIQQLHLLLLQPERGFGRSEQSRYSGLVDLLCVHNDHIVVPNPRTP